MGSFVHTSNWHMKPIAYVASQLDRNLEALSFTINLPAEIPLQQIKDGFEAMPPRLKYLSIETHFAQMSEEAMLAMTARLPETLNTVEFWFAQFEKLQPTIYAKLLGSLKSGINTLSLRNHHFNDYTPNELKVITESIGKNINKIELSHGNFRKFLQYLPEHIKSVQLQFNLNFYGQNGQTLSQHFNTLNPGVEELSIANNCFNKISADEITIGFSSIPKHITTLNLSDCNFGNFSTDDFKKIINAIPDHVKSINLSKNDLFSENNPEKSLEIAAFLQNSAHHFNLTDNGNHPKQPFSASFFQPATQQTSSAQEDRMEIAYK